MKLDSQLLQINLDRQSQLLHRLQHRRCPHNNNMGVERQMPWLASLNPLYMAPDLRVPTGNDWTNHEPLV